MRILSVVPARGGSKGLPGKNIRELCGKPLIAYAIEASIASDLVTDTVVSTDDPEIAKVGKAFGAQSIMRPPELAQDTSLVIDAMKHVVREQEKKGLTYNYVVLLEPTSPLRTVADIDDTIKMVVDEGADSGATFSEIPTPPARVWRINNNVPTTLIEGAKPFLPRQAHEPGYYINGMVYVVKVSKLMNTEGISFLLGKQVANVVPSDRVVDIDSLRDFEMAEFILSNKLKEE